MPDLIDDFYHSNHDLLLVGIRLQYLQKFETAFNELVRDNYRLVHQLYLA